MEKEYHELYEQAKAIILEAGYCSGELLREKLNIGMNASGFLVDQLERDGIVTPFDGSKRRKLNIHNGKVVPSSMIRRGKVSLIRFIAYLKKEIDENGIAIVACSERQADAYKQHLQNFGIKVSASEGTATLKDSKQERVFFFTTN